MIVANEAEYAEARANLDRAGWTVDYILTHCGPTSIQNDLLGPLSKPDAVLDIVAAGAAHRKEHPPAQIEHLPTLQHQH